MAAIATLNWSNSPAKRVPRSWTKTMSWTVVGAKSEDEAFTASVSPGTPAIPTEGGQLTGTQYICTDRTADRSGGPFTWTVTCNLSTSAVPGSGGGDPLMEPPVMSAKTCLMSVTREYDVNGNPITNSALQPFATMPTYDIPYIDLIVEQNEPTFDIAAYSAFAGGVNGNDLTLGNLHIPKRCCLAHLPEMVGNWRMDNVINAYVRVRYVFSICTDPLMRLDDKVGPWDFVSADVGAEGWYADGAGKKSIGRFVSKSAEIMTLVRLDGTGLPLANSNMTASQGITVGGKAPVASGFVLGTGMTIASRGDVKMIGYQTRKAVTFPTFS